MTSSEELDNVALRNRVRELEASKSELSAEVTRLFRCASDLERRLKPVDSGEFAGHTPEDKWEFGNENNECSDVQVGETSISLSRHDIHTGALVIEREEMLANRSLVRFAPNLLRERDEARRRVAELEAVLRSIAEHPHCSYESQPTGAASADRQYAIGVTDGHRCAAEVARIALATSKPGSPTPGGGGE